jgi:hypothetical protein
MTRQCYSNQRAHIRGSTYCPNQQARERVSNEKHQKRATAPLGVTSMVDRSSRGYK